MSSPQSSQKSRGNAGKIGLFAGVVALVAAAAWGLLGGATSDSNSAADLGARGARGEQTATAQKTVGKSWRQQWQAAGFKAGRAQPPSATTPALAQAGKTAATAAGIATRLSAWRQAGSLRPVSLRQARHHAVRSAAALFTELEAGKAAPVHAMEAAWLTRTLCDAAGLSCRFVLGTAGVQTPLLLSHSRVGVQVAPGAGPPLSPLGHKLASTTPLSDSQAAAWWLLVRAQAARAASRYKDAHADIALAERLAPGSAAPAFARGVVQLDQGLLDRGLDTCASALARQEDPFARLFLADILAAMDKPFKAYQHVQRVLQTHPKLAEAHVSLALLDAGRAQTAPEKGKQVLLDKASAGFVKALALDGNVPGARAGLAQIALMAGKDKEAERLLQEAVDKHGDAQAALVLAELLGVGQRSAEAVTMLRKLGKRDDARFVLALVKALALSGQAAAALTEAQDGAKRFPGSAQLGLLAADLLRQSGRITDAIAALEAHKTGPEGARISAMQAQLYLQDGKTAEAIGILAPLLKANPSTKELHLLLIVAYGLGSKRDAQAQAWRAAVATGGVTWLDIAGVLIETGDAAGAESALKAGLAKVAAAEAEGQQLATMLAMLLTASKRKAEAIRLRDQLSAQISGEAAKTAFRTAIDEAIAGAEAELERMATEPDTGAESAPAPQENP